MKHIFIINPAAGKYDRTEEFSGKIAAACASRGLDYAIHVSEKPGDCRATARRAAESGEEVRLYACGGDGTLNEVVNGAAGFANAAVTHFPGGSGNDAIKIFSEPAAFTDLDRLLDAEEARLDLIRCNGMYALNILSIGLDARIGTDIARYKHLPFVTGKGAYILESYDKAAFMTASKLGKTVAVSESTVVRFAVELGFDGYPSMQRSLQEMVRTRLTSVQRIEAANDRFGDQDVVSSVLQSDIDSIRLTAESLDRREMAACVEAILQAKHIYIVGVRSSAALAAYLNFYFRNLFDNVRLVSSTATSEMFEQMLRVGAGDVVLGISLPRYSGRTVKVMQYAHDRQATVLAITDKPDAPAGKFADHVLVAKSGMVSVVDSLVAAMSVINALVVSIGRSQERLLTQTFENLEHIWDEYDVYERVQ